MSEPISFGTDGWRAVIADEFTFENVRRVSRAIAVAGRTLDPPEGIDRNTLVVGFDRRFLSREFAGAVAEELKDAGYRVVLSSQPTPSQTISYAVAHRKVIGGVIVTASHNPAKYNGIKFKAWYGGSALPEMYAAIARSLDEQQRRGGGAIREENVLDEYAAGVREQLDIDRIRAARIAVLHDPIYGVSAMLPSKILGLDYLGSARILQRHASELLTETIVDGIRGEINPSFGGVNPEPIPENLAAARNVMLTGEYDVAICNDGDADRLGVLDEHGEFVSPHKIISLLALYLVREKKMSGDLVKTFSTTRLIEKIARALGARLHETPIGFKYVADLMLSRKVLIGGEESGGIGFGHFLPERDGVLSGMMVVEAVAHYGRPLSEIVAAMEQEFGALHYGRRDVHRPMDACKKLIDRARSGELNASFGPGFTGLEEKDGVKMNFADGSWILFRMSGTEPMIRIYAESPSRDRVHDMLETAVAQLDRS